MIGYAVLGGYAGTMAAHTALKRNTPTLPLPRLLFSPSRNVAMPGLHRRQQTLIHSPATILPSCRYHLDVDVLLYVLRMTFMSVSADSTLRIAHIFFFAHDAAISRLWCFRCAERIGWLSLFVGTNVIFWFIIHDVFPRTTSFVMSLFSLYRTTRQHRVR